MTLNGIFQIVLYFGVLLALTKPMGAYMVRVYGGSDLWLKRLLGPLERLMYQLCGIRPDDEMDWKAYALSMMVFNVAGVLLLYAIQRVQGLLPLNPQGLGAVAPDLAFNTAASFATNTNWQAYTPETTMSYLTQMAGLAVQNFASAATGMAIAVALIRGFARRSAQTIGSFWLDLIRGTLYVLLPISLVLAVVFVSQGMVQTFSPYLKVNVVQPTTYDEPVTGPDGQPVLDAKGQPQTKKSTLTEQVLAVGPAASQVAIKMLGTNGGGFFNANSAHPYENPTPLTNFLQMLAIFLIPAGLTYTFGVMVKDTRQGWAVFAAMALLFVISLAVAVVAEQKGNPILAKLGADEQTSPLQPGGNMEGKETRFGIANSALFATITTAASCGAVNSMHDSYTPLGGLVPMWQIQLDEVVFGGVGSGLYGMFMYVIIAVFIAGLMVGRTPEYVGKKIEGLEIKMASIFILLGPVFSLGFTAIAVVTSQGLAGMTNPGPHGLSQVLYAFSSAVGNNGSAFAGLNANSLFYNIMIGITVLFGRYWMALPTLVVAGSLARKKIVPASAGTLPTTTSLFVVLVAGTVLLVGALTFFPALSLGPIVEQLNMIAFK
jgi:K+-transporting ATPase ATPase A chain